MDGLCSELLLIRPPLSNPGTLEPAQSPCASGNPTPLPADPGCLLVEATATEEEPGSVEIIVEAVGGNLSSGAPGASPGVLVKVVEVYFCERCEQSFAEPALLALHQCAEPPPQPVQGPASPPCSAELPVSHLPLPGPGQAQGPSSDPLPCPVCRQEFAQPQALKSHFKIHRGPPDTFSCPESGCAFSADDRKGLRQHLRQTHSAAPVPCAFRGCPLLFGSQRGMELHRQAHYPLHCRQCGFLGSSVRLFRQHQRSHGAGSQGEPSATTDPSSKELPPAPQRPPGGGQPSEEAEENMEEEEESGTLKDSRKAPEKGQGAQQLEGDVALGTEPLFKTHMCPECKRCFKKRTHLVEHLHLHFPDPSLQCPNCQKFFTSKSKLKTHLLRERGQKAHCCPLCSYSAVERNALSRHMASMHGDISSVYSDTYACPVCRQEFRLSQALKEHLKSHTAAAAEPLPLACFQEGCSYAAPGRKAFTRHLRESHGVRAVECRHHACPMLFATAEAMEAHRKSHYAFHCPHCDFACSNKHLFRRHKQQGHPGSEELRCSFCPFATFNPVAYQDHVGKMHAHEKIHQCPECSFATAHKRVLIRHLLLHTGEKPHKCELCDFTCRDVSYLSKHMLTHSDTKDHMCSECGYVTKWKHYLRVHMRKHSGDLRYQCNQCSYRCHRADQLSSHKLRHQGKSLMCEVCAFACKRKYELQKHMASQHHPGKPAALYPCRYCSHQSHHKQALLSHENCKHTRLREFRCALCDYRAFSNTTLFFHKRKAHGHVPGDQVWQLRCASREPEEAGQCPTPPGSEASGQRDPSPGAGADPSVEHAVPEAGAGSQGGRDVPRGDGLVGSPRPAAAEVEEGSCTLHLEALGVELGPVAEPPLGEMADTAAVEFGPLRLEGPAGTLPELSAFEGAGASGVGAEEEPVLEKPVPAPPRDPPSSQESPSSWVGTFKPTPPAEAAPLPPLPESESVLKALRRQDKEQAEALVLEGRVQMVVVQGAGQAFHCPRCPFVTQREKALRLHSRTGCQGRQEPLRCPECGAHFKQQRGLSTHLLKKCPVLLKKNKGLAGTDSPVPLHPLPPGTPTSEAVEGGEPPPAPSEAEAVLPRGAPELPGEPEETDGSLATLSGSTELPAGNPSSPEAPEKFHFEQGKFHCNSCAFLCSRLSSITSHVADGCRGVRGGAGRRGAAQAQPVVSPPGTGDPVPLSSGSTEGGPGAGGPAPVPKQKGARFSCPTCPFRCQQERALKTHLARGCPLDRPGELRCGLCAFTAPVAAALRLHQRRRHPPAAPARGPRPPLRCGDCGFVCKQSRCLRQHRRLKHEGVKPHQCAFCDFATTRRYRLEAHQSRHTGVGRIACSSCPQTFGTNSKLRLHRLRVHDKTPTHFCQFCDYSGYLRHDIARHVSSCHRGPLAVACPQCEAQFSSETALKQHALRRHPEPAPPAGGPAGEAAPGPPRLQCGACGQAFPSRPALDEHRRRQHFSHRCQLCDFAARERGGLVRHYLQRHEEPAASGGQAGQPPLRCPFCDFACRHQLVLDHHVKGHGGTRLYKCTDCAYSTKNRQKITWHSRTHTGEKPYRCHLCPYACADPSRLKYHMRIHKEERKYLCPDCGYKCKWVNQLKYHMTKHTGLKPYQCPECEYCTNRADALRVHQETRHREARAFMCEQCGKAFKTRFLLRTHLRKHSEAKPYVCNVCHRAFRWAAGLRHHALTHTDHHPFFCRLCSYKAKQKFQVVKHVRRHHPDQADPNQGVGKDPTTPTVHLHDVQLEDPSPPALSAPPTGPEG
ncbi:zinc finger protein 142 isoform X2 [Pipistrellus kuhlii]|uniref:zinc finger protein 142 isoform X2 n=1 Tax=Pipistrellus kuhlii TaxID=59472 RepID=UPI00174F100C|nr:zinc finger protein 142 isoform X2 [Pipistrellus kuhlii]